MPDTPIFIPDGVLANPLDADDVIRVDRSGRTMYTRVEEFASDPAFSAQYAPLGSVVPIISHSKEWDVASGAPAYGASALGAAGQRHGAMLFDGAALEAAYTFVALPEAATFDLWLIWANPSATAGDVVWQAQYEFSGPDNELGLFTTGDQVTITSPATNVVTETRLLSGVARGTATSAGIKILRRGDVAGDTVNSVDVAGIAVRVEAAA